MTMDLSVKFILVFLLNVSFVLCSNTVIRGLPPSKLSLYDANKDFQCLDGSQSIPFSHINDDYCDCVDGTDEPGTSACPNGSFYCRNPGYKPLIIPSSRINDGICDCCDGEDEYNSRAQCANRCIELGQQLKVEEERLHKLKLEGYEIYQSYVKQSFEVRTAKQARLQELQRELNNVEKERAAIEKRKNELEEPEKEAKERHQKWWEEEKLKRKEEKKLVLAKDAFESLDANHDEKVSIEELTSHLEFDIDSNGEVSLDEAKEYLEENNEVTFDTFVEKVWDNIHQIFRLPGDTSQTVKDTEQDTSDAKSSDTSNHEELEDEHDDHYGDVGDDGSDDDDDERQDDQPENEEHKKPSSSVKKEEVEEPMPDYDESTKYLIDAAEHARQEYHTVDGRFRDIENEINGIKKVLDQDLGSHGEFFPLLDKCFDYTDREYIYSLCPFDRAAQRGKNGGVETNLGRWGTWSGPSDYKYAVMKYEHGLNCWNGPDRSAKVHVQCGLTNEVVSVTEPNRCEYRFVFNTPAACNQPPEPFDPHVPHTEL